MIELTEAAGLKYYFPAHDGAVGALLRNNGEFSRVVADFLIDHADGAGTMVDVGANIGAIALPFAKARPGWRVQAVEAHRGLAMLLSANVVTNELLNIEVHSAAVGAASGLIDFPAPALDSARNFGGLKVGGEDNVPHETVRLAALDDLAMPDTRLVKVDVEGYEPEVLKGARKLIGTRRAIWILETVKQHREASIETIRVMMDAGYDLYWLWVPFVTPNAPRPRKQPSTMGDANVVALPPGTPNRWNLTPVVSPEEERPGDASNYPYLTRYGYID